MKPKEKAFELITKFQHPISDMSDTDCLHIEVAKEFAIIAVEMILETLDKNLDSSQFSVMNYWNEIKEEIQKF